MDRVATRIVGGADYHSLVDLFHRETNVIINKTDLVRYLFERAIIIEASDRVEQKSVAAFYPPTSSDLYLKYGAFNGNDRPWSGNIKDSPPKKQVVESELAIMELEIKEYTAFAYYEQYVINDDLGGKALFNHARQLATEADCGFYTVAKGEEDRKRLIGFGFKDTGLCSDSNHILLGSTPSTNKRVPHECSVRYRPYQKAKQELENIFEFEERMKLVAASDDPEWRLQVYQEALEWDVLKTGPEWDNLRKECEGTRESVPRWSRL